jgi:hypothetical protein
MFLLPYVGMKSCTHCVCNVHAHVYGGVFLIFNMVAVVAKFGCISAEFEGKVTTTRILRQVWECQEVVNV